MTVATRSTPRLRRINPVIFEAIDKGIFTEAVLNYLEMYAENRQAQLNDHGLLKDPSVLKHDAEHIVAAAKKAKNSRATIIGEKLLQMAGQFKATEPTPTSNAGQVSMKTLVKSVEQDLQKGSQPTTIRKRGKRKQVA